MRIQLYLQGKILNFSLPQEISGSFSFDEKEDEEAKLINVEATDQGWVLYSTEYVKIISDNNEVKETKFVPNSFYIVRRDNKNYLLYTSEIFDDTIQTYSFNNDINMVISNRQTANINYNCEYLGNIEIKVYSENNNLILETSEAGLLYVNERSLSTPKYYLRNGDKIDLCGLKITFLHNLVLINNPNGKVNVREDSANIFSYSFPKDEEPKEVEFKDDVLYTEEDYFSKSPRIRRIIETKEIEFSQPPNSNKEKELPFILTIGPMMTMGIMSVVTLASTFGKIASGESSFGESWSQILMAGAMLLSMLLWPIITNWYNKRLKEKQRRELIKKYNEYLRKKEKELQEETNLQKEIIIENIITTEECSKIILNRTTNFWNKRVDQNDFLVVRIGMGNELLDIDVKWPEEGFTTEEDILKDNALKLLNKYKYIQNVPLRYSLFENRFTAVMGTKVKTTYFVNNLITQLLAFYSYEDLKIVVFTNEENEYRWDYLKYTNHNFSNDKSIRFFSNNPESASNLCAYLSYILSNKEPIKEETDIQKPYYLIITDDYSQIKHFDFIKEVTETEDNMGFSILFIENKLKNLPSRCNDFISLGDKTSGILENSYEKQEQRLFHDEINYTINMMDLTSKVSNIPIEFDNEEGQANLPESITFLEMEKVGKVKQLNILNRWNTCDTTQSLKAEIGVGEDGNYMYLDLHEKFHGPHGLIAGMTGSGKSEFIITWILSMCINYSPDEVAFILIDYKGGGLAFAFENQATGVRLPHLAGTITNLDKAEMDRTLVSIESEAQRRQKIFNKVRDELGESTLDIYKYQQFYNEGKVEEPLPHLFIICDEFAELKSQQPDFMDNLISIARIGRSLGVHLILATQKPSGVVNDQIWSNAKFHVCLKVQDASDSNEMLKKPDAAALKEAGRFYLQVGYDEYFALGQSAWCGAKYYPADQIVKQVDKSVNFIDDIGMIYKSIQAGSSNTKKVEEQGEQISAVMDEIIKTAKQQNKMTKRLWLENIPEVILVDNLIKKYNLTFDNNNIKAIIGEYDAPEKQEQGLLEYNYLEQGNTIIYSREGEESEQLLDSIIYSTIKNYSSEYINFYILDYGSQSSYKFKDAPHVGDIVTLGDDEKYNNLFKMISDEIKERKKLFAQYGGSYENYQKNSDKVVPLKIIILNNYDSINENDQKLFENLPKYVRDSERYGIIFIATATGNNSISNRIAQNFGNIYAIKLKDEFDYSYVLPAKKKMVPRDMFGRGLYKTEGLLHEFQTASITNSDKDTNEYVIEECNKLKNSTNPKAKHIPILPDQVTLDYVEDKITDITQVPIGINSLTLSTVRYDFTKSLGNIITANDIKYLEGIAKSLLIEFTKMNGLNIIVFDPINKLESATKNISNYYIKNLDNILDKLNNYIEDKIKQKEKKHIVILSYCTSKLINSIVDTSKINNMFKLLKKYEKATFILLDNKNVIKEWQYEEWYKGNFSADGIYVGNGVAEQNILKISSYSAELNKVIANNMGYYINEGQYKKIKLIEFEKIDLGDDNE